MKFINIHIYSPPTFNFQKFKITKKSWKNNTVNTYTLWHIFFYLLGYLEASDMTFDN